MTLSPKQTRIFRQALRRARVSLPGIAEELGISPITLQVYLHLLPPSGRVAVKFRRWMVAYCRQLQQLARHLPAKEPKL